VFFRDSNIFLQIKHPSTEKYFMKINKTIPDQSVLYTKLIYHLPLHLNDLKSELVISDLKL
jgi:hypothetical protein